MAHSLDITALKLLKYRDRYERLASSVPKVALDPTTAILLDDFGAYFREFPETKRIESGPFYLWFRGFRHPTLSADAASVFEQVLGGLREDVDPAVEAGLLERLVAATAAYNTAQLVADFQEGKDVDLRAGLEQIKDAYDAQIERKVKNPQVLDPIEDLLQAEADDVGIHWPWATVNRSIKPMTGGTFVVVAARPDKGKTTTMSQIVTHAAPQIDVLFPNENRSILWLNNEGPGKEIIKRTFQSAIGKDGSTIEDLAKLNYPLPEGDPDREQYKSAIRREYAKAIGGRMGVLRVFDIHGYSHAEVENLIRKYNPALVVFDMVDNISFSGNAMNNGQRTDQLLEAMYQWARLLGVKYDTAVIATSQVSGDGDGLQWPTLTMLKDSKTGKQGAADVIIVLGATNEPMEHDLRYLGTTKNKRARTGMPSNPRLVLQFVGDRARLKEFAV